MKNQIRLCLATMLSVTVAVSCRKTDLGPEETANEHELVLPTVYSPPVNASSPNLLFEETVEGATPFANAHSWEVGDWDYALNFVNGPAFQGNRSVRFEIRDDDAAVTRIRDQHAPIPELPCPGEAAEFLAQRRGRGGEGEPSRLLGDQGGRREGERGDDPHAQG